MGNPTDKPLRGQLIFGAVVLMLIALFTSRALLSVAMIAFLAFTCLHLDFLRQLKTFLRNRFLVGMSVLFLLPLLGGLWSEDQHQWLRTVRIKLPLLLLPIAFAGRWQLRAKQWQWIAVAFLLLVAAGCCWSLYQYGMNAAQINQGYLRAKSIPTPLENDHIRFSLLVCAGVITTVLLCFTNSNKKLRTALIILAIFFATYLHILSARTGLAGLYIFLVLGMIALIIRSGSRKLIAAVIAAAIILPAAAWWLMPTFQNRVRYMMYDLQHIRADQYLPGSNDGSRLVSLKAGWQIMNDNPAGVGTGDVVNATKDWYALHVPEMVATGLYPSSEWLMYGAMAGWAGFILFSIIICLPFFEKTRYRFFWIALNAVTAFSLAFDIGLEVQFGVFIYAFLVLWWWKWLQGELRSSGKI